ncbi:glycosyltransferase [bacterium]|nr:glycosyltransferase [bacterium]
MKIFHFISSPAAGGAEIYVKNLVVKLRENSESQFAVLFLYKESEIGRDELFAKQFVKELQNNGIPYYYLGAKPSKHLSNFFKVLLFLLKNRADILHIHVPVALVYSFFSPAKIVYTHHTIKKLFPKLAFNVFNIRVRYIAICRACKVMLKNNGARNVLQINNGIPICEFSASSQYKKEISNIVKLLCVGRLVPSKNYAILFDVVDALKDDGVTNFIIRIAGEGDQYEMKCFRKKIRQRNAEEHIELLGQVSEIPPLMWSSDIFLMSSVSEGLPISLIEATAAGLPSIVTDVGGCAEVIQSCQSGQVVQPNDTFALTRALKTLITDRDLRNLYSKNAKLNAYKYGIGLSSVSHLNLYQRCFGKEWS